MTVVSAELPHCLTRIGIKQRSGRIVREYRKHEIQHADDSKRVVAALLRRDIAERKRSRDIRRAVQIVCAGVHKEKSLGLYDITLLLRGHVVCHCRICLVSRDGREAQGHILRIRCAERIQLLAEIVLGVSIRLALLDGLLEPVEEAGQMHTVTDVAIAEALELGIVLDDLHQGDRAQLVHNRVLVDNRIVNRKVQVAEISQDSLVLQLADSRNKLIVRADRNALLLKMLLCLLGECILLAEELRRARLHHEIGQEDRVASDVGTVQVRDPGNLIQSAGQENARIELLHLSLYTIDLALCLLARVLDIMHPDRLVASLRAILPDIVDEIKVGNQLTLLSLDELLQLFSGVRSEQRRAERKGTALREMILQVFDYGRRTGNACLHQLNAAVLQLDVRLYEETAVRPEECFFLEHHQGAGISREPTDFANALISGTDFLTAVCIGIRLIIHRDSTLLHRLAKLLQFFSHIGLLVIFLRTHTS